MYRLFISFLELATYLNLLQLIYYSAVLLKLYKSEHIERRNHYQLMTLLFKNFR
jgi:hypothetical protein